MAQHAALKAGLGISSTFLLARRDGLERVLGGDRPVVAEVWLVMHEDLRATRCVASSLRSPRDEPRGASRAGGRDRSDYAGPRKWEKRSGRREK